MPKLQELQNSLVTLHIQLKEAVRNEDFLKANTLKQDRELIRMQITAIQDNCDHQWEHTFFGITYTCKKCGKETGE